MSIKRAMSRFLDNHSHISLEKIKKLIDSHDVISFDMFDTLVKRDCDVPTDVFSYMECDKRCTLDDFTNIRIKAEKKARETSTKQDITLDEIYDAFPLSVSVGERDELKQIEMSYEKSLCQLNPEIIPVIDYAKEKGKKLIVVTDMYLSDDVLKAILDRNGIEYSKLYSSGHYGVTKHDGGLYNIVLEDIGISPKKVLHIGDSYKSDYLMARMVGIDAVHIKKESYTCRFIDRRELKNNSEYRSLCHFISNHREYGNNDIFYSTGYECLGPVLYGFEKWLIKQLKSEGFRDVYFLARDGQIMKRAFDLFDTGIRSHYFFGSRRALIVPTLWMHPELPEINKRISRPRIGTIASYFHMIGIDARVYREAFHQVGFNVNEEYVYEDLFNNADFQKIYLSKIQANVISESKKEYNLLQRYIEQENMSGRVAIVDIGWYGNMQRALCEILGKNADVYGYYMGIYPDSRNVLDNIIKAEGYLFDTETGHDRYNEEYVFTPIFENLFAADHGTTIGYSDNGSSITPILSEWEYKGTNDYEKIKIAQNAAISFIKEAVYESSCTIEWPTDITFANMASLGCRPDLQTAKVWGNIKFQNSINVLPIADPSGKLFYFEHPMNLISDISNCYWKIGFLTRLIGDKIPHYKIYSFVRKLLK